MVAFLYCNPLRFGALSACCLIMGGTSAQLSAGRQASSQWQPNSLSVLGHDPSPTSAGSPQPLAFPPAPEARQILNDLLEKYATDGELQFTLPDVLKVPPISSRGNVAEIASRFGGPDDLRTAVNQLQTLLYAA